MELVEDLIYNVTWRLKQTVAKITKKTNKNYTRILTLKEILKGG